MRKWGHSSFPSPEPSKHTGHGKQKGTRLLEARPLLLGNEECPHFLMSPFLYALPAFESVGVWKYSLSEASCSMRRLSSDMRPSAVLIGMQS